MWVIWILMGLLCHNLFANYFGTFDRPTDEELKDAPAGVWWSLNSILFVGSVILWPVALYVVYKIDKLK